MSKVLEIIFGIFLILAALEVGSRFISNPCSVWSDKAYMCSSDNIGE